MKKDKRWYAVLVTAAALFLCGILLLLPYGWTSWMDHTRVNCVGVRPQIPGLLAPEARRIPALYVLHSGEWPQMSVESDWKQEDVQPALEKIGEELAQTGVLSETMLESYQALLASPAEQCTVNISDQLVSCTLNWRVGKLPAYQMALYVTYTATEQKALDFQVTIPADISAERMAVNFADYLGVDVLPDWEVTQSTENDYREYQTQIGQAMLTSSVWQSGIHVSLREMTEH